MGKCVDWIEIGNRVWTGRGYLREAGGTITAVFNGDHDWPLHFRVKWDEGDQGTCYFDELDAGKLFCIGRYATLADYRAAMLESAISAKLTLGPNGGFRKLRIELTSGDYAVGARTVLEELQLRRIVTVERLPRKGKG